MNESRTPAAINLTRDLVDLVSPQQAGKTYGRATTADLTSAALRGWTIELPWHAGAVPSDWTTSIDSRERSGSVEGEFSAHEKGDWWTYDAFLNGSDSGGSQVDGWVQLSGRSFVTTAAIRYFYQTYPKAISADGTGLRLELCSPRSGRPEFLDTRSGVAKSHEMFLDFRPAAAAEAARAQARQFLSGPRPKMDPTWVRKSQVYFMFADADSLSSRLDAKITTHWRSKGYDSALPVPRDDWGGNFGIRGIKNYGDFVDTGKVGARGRWNNHYSLPRELLHHWIRTGDHFMFTSAEAGVWHMMDIDVQHSPGPGYNPKEPDNVHGARWTHYSMDHQGAQTGNHWWMGGLPEYYLITGNPRAREVLGEMADYLVASEGVGYGHVSRTADPRRRSEYAAQQASSYGGSDFYRVWTMSSVACVLIYEAIGREDCINSARNGVLFLRELWTGPWDVLIDGVTYPAKFAPPRGLFATLAKSPDQSKDTRAITGENMYQRVFELPLRFARVNTSLRLVTRLRTSSPRSRCRGCS